MTVLCVPVLCCVPAVCLSLCENRPQHAVCPCAVLCFARQCRYEPPPESLLTLPFSRCVHHLSGPHTHALTQNTFKITKIHFHVVTMNRHRHSNLKKRLCCVSLCCAVSLLCVCPRVETGHSTQHRNPKHAKNSNRKKIINSRDDEIRFEFDE